MKVVAFVKKVAASTGFITCSDSSKVDEVTLVQTRTLSLADLLRGFDRMEKTPPATPANELAVDFDKLFEMMNVSHFDHGWSAKSVATYLQSSDILKLNSREAKEAMLHVLHENKVPLEDILSDAVNRDQALDACEEFALQKLQERTSKREQETARCEKEIADCKERIRSNKDLQAQDEQAYQEWLQKKIAHEEQLVKVVSLITTEDEISVGSIKGKTTTERK